MVRGVRRKAMPTRLATVNGGNGARPGTALCGTNNRALKIFDVPAAESASVARGCLMRAGGFVPAPGTGVSPPAAIWIADLLQKDADQTPKQP
jgi:hypothetical protein